MDEAKKLDNSKMGWIAKRLAMKSAANVDSTKSTKDIRRFHRMLFS